MQGRGEHAGSGPRCASGQDPELGAVQSSGGSAWATGPSQVLGMTLGGVSPCDDSHSKVPWKRRELRQPVHRSWEVGTVACQVTRVPGGVFYTRTRDTHCQLHEALQWARAHRPLPASQQRFRGSRCSPAPGRDFPPQPLSPVSHFTTQHPGVPRDSVCIFLRAGVAESLSLLTAMGHLPGEGAGDLASRFGGSLFLHSTSPWSALDSSPCHLLW